MDYKLSMKQEKRFENLYNQYQDKIRMAVYKCNINSNNFEHFYSHALEGFLQSFLLLDAGEIKEDDFVAFAYVNMKRKVIDELRRVTRNKDISVDFDEKYTTLAYIDYRIDSYITKSSIISCLSKKEERVFRHLENGYSYKDISRLENISKSTYYKTLSSIRYKAIPYFTNEK